MRNESFEESKKRLIAVSEYTRRQSGQPEERKNAKSAINALRLPKK